MADEANNLDKLPNPEVCTTLAYLKANVTLDFIVLIHYINYSLTPPQVFHCLHTSSTPAKLIMKELIQDSRMTVWLPSVVMD